MNGGSVSNPTDKESVMSWAVAAAIIAAMVVVAAYLSTRRRCHRIDDGRSVSPTESRQR